MKDYHINIFYSDEDKCYIADIPDLVFCSAHGETPLKALKEILIAKELWLEVAQETGKPIPAPKYKPRPVVLPRPKNRRPPSSSGHRTQRSVAGP